MVVRIVTGIVAHGGVLTVEGDRLRCRLPVGTELPDDLGADITANKPAILAVFQPFLMEETVAEIRAMTPEDRAAYRTELAFDLAAWVAAEAQNDPSIPPRMRSGAIEEA